MSRLLTGLAIAPAIVAAATAGALLWPAKDPGSAGTGPEAGGLAFHRLAETDPDTLPPLDSYRGADGAELAYRTYPADSPLVLILIHGSGYRGAYLQPLAQALAERGVARVVTPNIRGHHRSGPRRGDIDRIGRLESDLAALLDTLRARHPDARFALAGHSSGGGFALRMAADALGERIAGLVMLAPYLGHDAASTRPDSGGWAQPVLPRIIALSVLNRLGISHFNGLTTLSFAMPETARDGTETLAYSYRLMTAFGPSRAPRADAAMLERPALLLAGTADEAMKAPAYRDMFADRPRVEVELLEGAGHLDLVADRRAHDRVAGFLETLAP